MYLGKSGFVVFRGILQSSTNSSTLNVLKYFKIGLCEIIKSHLVQGQVNKTDNMTLGCVIAKKV